MTCPRNTPPARHVDRYHLLHTGFACVHSYPAACEPELRRVLGEAGLVLFTLDVPPSDDLDILSLSAEAMRFPTPVGGWDGWNDWARDLEWAPSTNGYALLVRGADVLWRRDAQSAGELVNSWLFCAEHWARQVRVFALVFLT
jgi:hypothetical protein